MDLLIRANEIKDEIINYRRFFHQNPEIGDNLDKTVEYVKARLTEMGYEPKDCGKCGVVAMVGQGDKVFLLRGDMDALPMKEESGLDFSSTGDYAHTCGHDVHTAMLLGAAKILKEIEPKLNGRVKLMFQPGEECMTGAIDMINNNVLENPRVDAAAAIHIMALEDTGKILYNTGVIACSNDIFKIQVEGLGGHGATPHNTVDPINVGSHIVISLQEIIAREINPKDTAVLTVCSFKAGEAGNIIPQTATIMGTIRAYDSKVRDYLKKRAEEITKSVAETFRATATFEVLYCTPPMENDKETTEIIGKSFKEMLGEKMVFDKGDAMTGSEDFAYISERVPSAYFILGGNPGNREKVYGQHHPSVYFDENSMINGVACYVKAAVAWLDKNKC